MSRAKRYKVEVNLMSGHDTHILDVPDRCGSPYERISTYGLNAILERAKRSRVFKQLRAKGDYSIRAIILPNGGVIREF